MADSFDVIVIGSGPGGYSAAIRAAQYGLKTALIEKDKKLGGTCLHVGCVPTKALLHTAEVWEYFTHPEAQGIHVQGAQLDLPLVLQRKQKVVDGHANGISFLMKKHKVEVIPGYGRLKGRGQVEVLSESGTKVVDAKNIILATGSEARMLPNLSPDAKSIVTNVEILQLTEAPRKLLVIGAGRRGGVRLHLQGLRKRCHYLRDATPARAGGRRRGEQGTGAQLQKARHSL